MFGLDYVLSLKELGKAFFELRQGINVDAHQGYLKNMVMLFSSNANNEAANRPYIQVTDSHPKRKRGIEIDVVDDSVSAAAEKPTALANDDSNASNAAADEAYIEIIDNSPNKKRRVEILSTAGCDSASDKKPAASTNGR